MKTCNCHIWFRLDGIWRGPRAKKRGATATEYSLLAGFIALVIVQESALWDGSRRLQWHSDRVEDRAWHRVTYQLRPLPMTETDAPGCIPRDRQDPLGPRAEGIPLTDPLGTQNRGGPLACQWKPQGAGNPHGIRRFTAGNAQLGKASRRMLQAPVERRKVVATFLAELVQDQPPNSLRSPHAFSLHQPRMSVFAVKKTAPPPSNTASWSPSSPSSSSSPSALLGGTLTDTVQQHSVHPSRAPYTRQPAQRSGDCTHPITLTCSECTSPQWRRQPSLPPLRLSPPPLADRKAPPCPGHPSAEPQRSSLRSWHPSSSCCCWASWSSAGPTTPRPHSPARPVKASG